MRITNAVCVTEQVAWNEVNAESSGGERQRVRTQERAVVRK